MKIELSCYSCGKSLVFEDRVGFREECPYCQADVHSCRQCQHHDPKAYNECLEPAAEVVVEKERANYCEHFVAKKMAGSLSSSLKNKQDLLNAAEALFKKREG